MNRQAMQNLVLILLGLLILGGVGLLLGAWAHRWPRFRVALTRMGEAAVQMALGLLALYTVVLVLRSLGWLPPSP